MELQAPFTLASASDPVLGVSWARSNTLLVTTDHEIKLYRTTERACVRSWLTRPGKSSALTLPCVRCPSTGHIACIQAGTKVLVWQEEEASLASASKHVLKSPAITLAAASGRGFVVVSADATITVLSQTGQLLSSLASKRGTQCVWAGVTRLSQGRKQSGAVSHVLVLTRSNDQLQLQAYEVVLAAADSAVTLVASQALSPPSDDATIVKGTVNAKLQVLSLFWSDSTWQLLHLAGLMATPPSSTARVVRQQRLVLASTTGSSASASRRGRSRSNAAASSGAGFDVIGVEPSFVVVAGAQLRTAGATSDSKKRSSRTNKKRSRSASSDAGSNNSNSSAFITAWDATYATVVSATPLGDALGGEAVIGVAISDSLYAVASKQHVAVGSLRTRAKSSLNSTLGGAALTASFLAEADAVKGATAASATVDFDACMHSVGGAGVGAGGGAGAGAGAGAGSGSEGASLDRDEWRRVVDEASSAEAATLTQLQGCKSSAAFDTALAAYMNGKAGRSHKRQRTSTTGASTQKFAPSQSFVCAVVDHIVAHPKLALWPSLSRLLSTRRVSAVSSPSLLSGVLSNGQLDLVAQCLVKVSDLSERDLVRVFRFIAGQVTDKAVTAFRDAVLPASAQAAAGSVPREFMVEYFVCLLVKCPRNDVLLEQALRVLSASEVDLLVTTILRLLRKYWHAYLDHRPSVTVVVNRSRRGKKKHKLISGGSAEKAMRLDSAAGGGGGGGTAGASSGESDGEESNALPPTHKFDTALPLPSLAQVLDWARLVTDAHFARLVVRSAADKQLQAMLQDLRSLTGKHLQLCEAIGGLRGQLAHVLNREPLPVRPLPEYSIEVLSLGDGATAAAAGGSA